MCSRVTMLLAHRLAEGEAVLVVCKEPVDCRGCTFHAVLQQSTFLGQEPPAEFLTREVRGQRSGFSRQV